MSQRHKLFQKKGQKLCNQSHERDKHYLFYQGVFKINHYIPCAAAIHHIQPDIYHLRESRRHCNPEKGGCFECSDVAHKIV